MNDAIGFHIPMIEVDRIHDKAKLARSFFLIFLFCQQRRGLQR